MKKKDIFVGIGGAVLEEAPAHCPAAVTFEPALPLWATVRQPHRLLWLDSHSLTTAVAIYLIYSLYLVVTCGWLFVRRKHYLFRKNPLGITLCSALMQWLMGTSHIWRYYFMTTLPAALVIWRNYVFFPLCLVFSLQARGTHILFEVIWTRSIGHPALSTREGTGKGTLVQRLRRQLKNPRLHVWLKNRGTYIMAGTLSAIHLLAAAILQYIHRGGKFPEHVRSTLGVETFGIILSVGLYVVIWCPVMLFFLRDVKDAYGLRRDLKIGMSYALPCYILYTCFRVYDFLQHLRSELPSFLFLLFAMISLHSSTVTFPLIRTYRQVPEELDDGADADRAGRQRVHSPHDVVLNRRSGQPIVIPHRPMPLAQVLRNAELAAPFEEYSKSAFVWDSVYFYKAICAFRDAVCAQPKFLAIEAQRIYEQYIEPGAPCEMNLSYKVVARIVESLEVGDLSPDMFDEAQAEVLRLVDNCTYRNFLYTLETEIKARYMVPVGQTLSPKLIEG